MTENPFPSGKTPAAMRWLGGFVALILGVGTLTPEARAHDAEPQPVTLPRADQRLVKAKCNGLDYRILVSRPDGVAPSGGWPVVYVLDGTQHFPVVSELVRILSGRTEATGVPPAVVVGVGHPPVEGLDTARRTFDLTPAGSKEPGTGGADGLLAFLVDELQPVIASQLPVDRSRQVLIGHSYGGLFVLHAFFNRPAAFSGFVAFSPSIWWNDRAVLKGEVGLAERLTATGPRKVFLSVGGFEQEPDPSKPTPPARIEKLRVNRMVDNSRELADRLADLPQRLAQVEFQLFASENHGSIVAVSLPRALAFALEEAKR